jgi:predicted outer membrane repeat protein
MIGVDLSLSREVDRMQRVTFVSKPLFVTLAICLCVSILYRDPNLARAESAPIEVDTTDVVDDPNDGRCDLFEALQAAFGQKSSGDSPTEYHECTAFAGAKEVIFTGPAAGGTITIPSGPGSLDLPFITDDVTITGPVILDGGGEKRILRVANGGTLTLANLTMQNGYTAGGGGAILSSGGDINIIGSAFLGNTADNDGGAINTPGGLSILASNFAGNGAGRDGGAVYQGSSYKALQISLSTFNGNSAVKTGGALYVRTDDAEISDTIFNGNIVMDDNPDDDTRGGGAIYMQQAELTIERSVFNGNLSLDGNGGAIATSLSTKLDIRKSSFNGNIAGDLTSAHLGGALYNQETLNIDGATFLNNLSPKGNGGAIFNDKGAELNAANATFSANGATDGDGGAIYNGNTQTGSTIASHATFRNVTLYANLAGNEGSTFFNQDGNHTISLGNTIVDDGGGPGDNCNRDLTSLGHNLDTGSSCGLDGSGDLTNADADLEPPAFNGGPLADLFTHLPGENSDAIDAGDNAICSAEPVENEDQTGGLRPKDGDANGVPICDIGAVEADARIPGYGSDPIWPGPLSTGTTTVNTPVTATLEVFETGNATLTVGDPTFGGANAGEFDLVSPFVSFDIADGGAAVDIGIRCTPTAVGTRTASFSVTTNDPAHPSVSYDLACQSEAAPTPGFASEPAVGGTMDYGAMEVGDSAVRNLTIMETGNATLAYGNAELSGPNPSDFTFNAFQTSISDGGDPVVIPITCTPAGVGYRSATLTMTTNDPQNPTASWNLVCEGTPPPPPVLVEPGSSRTSPVNMLDGVNGVAVSPDGRHTYVASFFSDAVAVYERDMVTGDLTFRSGNSNTDLNGAQYVTVSPDGSQVYVTAGVAGNLIVFDRDGTTGDLSTAQTIRQSSYADLLGAYGVAVTPDGRFIYVTSNIQNALLGFERLPNGDLDFLFTMGGVDLVGTHNLSVSPDGKNLYVTAHAAQDTGKLVAYEIDPLTGTLSHLQTITEGDIIGGFPFILFVDALEGAIDVSVSPDGKNVYAVGRDDDAIARLDRNPADGTLRYRGRWKDGALGIDGLDGVSGVAVSPDGKHVYAAGFNDMALAVFSRDSSTGWIDQVQVINRSSPSPLLNGANDVGLAPDGSSVYAAAFLDDAVVSLHIANPTPVVKTLLPASTVAAGPGLTLTVEGESLVPGVQAVVNGTSRPATYVNPTTFQVDLATADVAAAGTLDIGASNPAPGGGSSANELTFVITAPGENPVPSIDALLPQGTQAGAEDDLLLTVNGANLIESSQVKWNGQDLVTTYVNETELQATVPATMLGAVGTAVVTVVNPAPGGGTSNPAAFGITRPWENPVPTIRTLDPGEVTLYGFLGEPIVIHVHGSGFIEDTQAQWNGENRPTQYVSHTEIAITLTAADTTPAGTGVISAYNPIPGGGTSNAVSFTIVRFKYGIFLPLVLQ